jgi:MtN3 and saliva related transmembrane protein
MGDPTVRLLGYAAACLTTASFFPQALKTVRTGDTQGISLRMYLLFTVGIATWALYGLLQRDGPVLIANLVTLVPAGVVLERKLRSLKR